MFHQTIKSWQVNAQKCAEARPHTIKPACSNPAVKSVKGSIQVVWTEGVQQPNFCNFPKLPNQYPHPLLTATIQVNAGENLAEACIPTSYMNLFHYWITLFVLDFNHFMLWVKDIEYSKRKKSLKLHQHVRLLFLTMNKKCQENSTQLGTSFGWHQGLLWGNVAFSEPTIQIVNISLIKLALQ